MQLVSERSIPLIVAEELRHKILARTARTAVVGLGYVGLPLAVELADSGFSVTGIDTDPEKVRRILAVDSYVEDVSQQHLAELVHSGKLGVTTEAPAMEYCDTVSVCVPTPLRKTKDPDLSYVVRACEDLATRIHRGMLVVLESTTYPGTTEEIVLPLLERSGLRAGQDFFLCFSPERLDPGNARYSTRNIPKVIAGITPKCREMGQLFYSQVIDRVIAVSSTRAAEMVKLLENTFRMINIGLANEIAIMCDRMNINVWEVIEAAATKPFGFMPFYPGPGIGGHCIPVDPHYLSWRSRQDGHEARFIDLAAHINAQMPRFVVEKVQAALNDQCKPVRGSRIHIIGVAYKRDVSDVRESPALDIIALLEKLGGIITYTDPLVPRLRLDSRVLESQSIETTAAEADCLIIVTDHSQIDYERLVDIAPLIIDTRNALKGIASNNIVRL